jgi:hypothetical protein
MAEAATEPFTPADEAELKRAFEHYEHGVSVDNARRAAALAALFMLAGTTLDWMVFPDQAWHFLFIRGVVTLLLCAVFWALGYLSREGSRNWIAQAVPFLPTLGICWMIMKTGGGTSVYYAGLNLVFLGMALLLRW